MRQGRNEVEQVIARRLLLLLQKDAGRLRRRSLVRVVQ
jgi:hypothetical protein